MESMGTLTPAHEEALQARVMTEESGSDADVGRRGLPLLADAVRGAMGACELFIALRRRGLDPRLLDD